MYCHNCHRELTFLYYRQTRYMHETWRVPLVNGEAIVACDDASYDTESNELLSQYWECPYCSKTFYLRDTFELLEIQPNSGSSQLYDIQDHTGEERCLHSAVVVANTPAASRYQMLLRLD